ncbi:MerR family transcriptional regulator [Lichenibacterium ramalinae]|uniref:MerR family transcriptional regulator n=1 Tax=Lichenibacterium ramalinae TaxID=2316527 RepID=A0A4Q2RD55_9HYPH|nr:MerR family transcriptional regulator [Lichenibacterium ramalinae]RYB04708.1 MerR family transcriptional regulator [Lichenibacterium ramalinae]
MKIGAFAERIGLSAHTIRYYERIGLLPRCPRDGGQRRDYDASALPWIAFLTRLRRTGMPIRDMVRYAEWRAAGQGTEAERRDLLVRHRDRVRAHVVDLQACLSVLDAKIAGYGDPPPSEPQHDTDTSHRRPVRPGIARPG